MARQQQQDLAREKNTGLNKRKLKERNEEEEKTVTSK